MVCIELLEPLGSTCYVHNLFSSLNIGELIITLNDRRRIADEGEQGYCMEPVTALVVAKSCYHPVVLLLVSEAITIQRHLYV